jgi:hypothetical protein
MTILRVWHDDFEWAARLHLLQRIKPQILGQISPLRIVTFKQRQFPITLPGLDLFLTGDGAFHAAVLFEPDEDFHAVPFGEAGDNAFAVLPDALHQIGGDAEVDGAVALAGDDVHGGVDFTFHVSGSSHLGITP